MSEQAGVLTPGQISAAIAAFDEETQRRVLRAWSARYIPFVTDAATRIAAEVAPGRLDEIADAAAAYLKRADRRWAGEKVTQAGGKAFDRLFSLVKGALDPPYGEWAWVLPAWRAVLALRAYDNASYENDVPKWIAPAVAGWAAIDTLFPLTDDAIQLRRKIPVDRQTERFEGLEQIGFADEGAAVVGRIADIVASFPADPPVFVPPAELWDRRDFRAGTLKRALHHRSPRPGERLRRWYGSDRGLTALLDEDAAAAAYREGRALWVRVMPERPEDAMGVTRALAEIGFRVDGTVVVVFLDPAKGEELRLFEPRDGRLFLQLVRTPTSDTVFAADGHVEVTGKPFAGLYEGIPVERHWVDRPQFGDWDALIEWDRNAAFFLALARRAMRAPARPSTGTLRATVDPHPGEGFDARAAIQAAAAGKSAPEGSEGIVARAVDGALVLTVDPGTMDGIDHWLRVFTALRRGLGDRGWRVALDDTEVEWSDAAGFSLN